MRRKDFKNDNDTKDDDDDDDDDDDNDDEESPVGVTLGVPCPWIQDMAD